MTLVAWNAWPPLGWAFVALVAWAAFPPWLFLMPRHIAWCPSTLGICFSLLVPVALLGGMAILLWHTLARDAHEFPPAVVAVPLAQLAVVLPFALNASTDTQLKVRQVLDNVG